MNKQLQRRFYLVQKAKDSAVIGIVVGTLGVGLYKDVIRALRALIRSSGRMSYTFVVGKLNPQKLGNFAAIVDCFVLVACPEAALFDHRVSSNG